MKLSSIFAAFNAKGTTHIDFYVDTHCVCTSALSRKDIGRRFPYTEHLRENRDVGSLARTGGDGLSYILTLLNFNRLMPKNLEIKVAVNNSTRYSAARHEKAPSTTLVELNCSNPYSIPTFDAFISETQRLFDVECNAKNKAYAFILSKGLINEFDEFCRTLKNK